jgi:hypothetical protein
MSEMVDSVRARAPTTSIAEWPDAEVFLLTALRCWLSGYETGDIACWELAWQGVCRKTPLAEAKRIIAELGQFTRVLRQTLTCRFIYLPYCCGRAMPEECLAVELVACAQSGDLFRAGELARRLCNNDDHFSLLQAASDLASALQQADFTLTCGRTVDQVYPGSRGVH